MTRRDETSLVPGDLVEEYAEIGADKLVEEAGAYIPMLEPLGSEIPYVKTIVAAIKLPRTISDFVLGKKVYAFLYSSKIDDTKLAKFKRKFSKAKQEQLWEQVVFSINMHDDRRKSEIIGKLFSALIEDEINEGEFFTMVHATNSLNMHVLDELKELYTLNGETTLSGSRYYSFVTNGLVDIDNSGIGTLGASGGPVYPLNQIGWKYVGIVFEHPPSAIEGYNIGEKELVVEYSPENQQATGKAYPLEYIKSRNMVYHEVDLFIIREDGQILCNAQGLPHAVGSVVPIAGEQPGQAAEHLAVPFGKKAHPIVIRNMEDVGIQKWAFAIKSDRLLEDTIFKPISDINVAINQSDPKTDHIRYLVKFIEQVERHVSGELREQWNDF